MAKNSKETTVEGLTVREIQIATDAVIFKRRIMKIIKSLKEAADSGEEYKIEIDGRLYGVREIGGENGGVGE